MVRGSFRLQAQRKASACFIFVSKQGRGGEYLEKKQFAIIGAGKVGSSLANGLVAAGYEAAAVSSRTNSSARALAERLGTSWTTHPAEAARQADIVWISTPDSMIGEVAKELAASGALRPTQYVYHLSGALTAEVLAPAAKAGAHIGVMHPLQSFAAKNATDRLNNIYFGLDGDAAAIELARTMVTKLGGYSLTLLPEQKPLYHAAACVASNYFVALVDYAVQLLQTTGFAEADARQAILPLLKGTIDNLAQRGTREALTGPIVRGDTATVEKHWQALATYQVDRQIYQVLGEYTAALAEDSGKITRTQHASLQSIWQRGDYDER